MQWSPIVSTTIRGALSNELLMYDLAWENLELVGGHLQIIVETYNTVTLQNIGWGAADNVTAGNGIIEKVGRNQIGTLSKDSTFLQYNRLIHEGEEADLTLISMNLTSMSNPDSGTTPSIGFISIGISLVFAANLRKKK